MNDYERVLHVKRHERKRHTHCKERHVHVINVGSVVEDWPEAPTPHAAIAKGETSKTKKSTPRNYTRLS